MRFDPFRTRTLASRIALAGIVGLAACGGGIGGSGTPMAGGGIGGTGSADAKATIARFGSVFAGGVEFDIAGAALSIDGVPVPETDLRPGMVVRVAGTVNPGGRSGAASRIAYENLLVGVVDALDAASGRLTILGQTVLMDETTTWHDPGPDTLGVGNVVEVSGYAGADGSIRATYVRFRRPNYSPGAVSLELRGTVSGLDAAAGTFSIGAQNVDFRAAQISGMPPEGLHDGLTVKVRSDGGVVNGVLMAGVVEAALQKESSVDGAWAAIEGLVTAALDNGTCRVDGRTVRLTDATRYERGAAADLVVNACVVVQGIGADGGIEARTVRFLGGTPLRIAADLDAVDPVAGTVTLLGKTFRVDGFTRLRDTSNDCGRPFQLGDVGVKDRVEFLGDGGTGGTAGQIVRTIPSTTVVLEGPVESASGVNLVVGGVTVRIAGSPNGVAPVAGGGPSSSDGLVGTRVRVEGAWDGRTFTADQVSVVP